ncbi:hypothetical protein EMCRGX_G006074 [Ephydatia muelleri]
MCDSNRLCSPCDHVIVEGQAARPPSREDAQSQRNQRNAIAARQNRLKKKQYVICLQTEIARLKAENTVLKSKCRDSDVTVAQLSNEKVPTIKEVKFPSFISCKREGAAAMNEDLPLAKKPALSGGVCLHVSQDVATLEFCSSCIHTLCQSTNKMAATCAIGKTWYKQRSGSVGGILCIKLGCFCVLHNG